MNRAKAFTKTAASTIATFLAVLMALVCLILPARVKAEDVTSREGSITVSINEDEWYVASTPFRLYKIADLDPTTLTYTYTDAFSSSSIPISTFNQDNVNSITNEQFQDYATTYITYVREHGVDETDMQRMTSSRSVTFDALGLGIYLIQGDEGREGNRSVVYQPQLVFVPYGSSYSTWTYDVMTVVKDADPSYSPSPSPTPTPNITPSPTPTPSVPPTPTPNLTPTPSNPGEPGAPNTGDNFRASKYIGILVIAIAVGIGAWMMRKDSPDSEEDSTSGTNTTPTSNSDSNANSTPTSNSDQNSTIYNKDRDRAKDDVAGMDEKDDAPATDDVCKSTDSMDEEKKD